MNRSHRHHNNHSKPNGANSPQNRLPVPELCVSAGLLVAIIWVYWPTVLDLVHVWRNDYDYSIGQLVPLAALWLVWYKRNDLRKCRLMPCWWGLALMTLAEVVWLLGAIFWYGSAMRYSLVIMIAGVVLLIAGREVFRTVRWILLFLLLIAPLPKSIHLAISPFLQDIATKGAAFCLELAGADVMREANVIVLGDNLRMGVVEACSGLRMLTGFIVVASVFAYMANRPRWQKIILLCSSIPIAVVCNVFRIVVTAGLYTLTSNAVAETFFHDGGGLVMVPLALAMLAGEAWLIKAVIIEEDDP